MQNDIGRLRRKLREGRAGLFSADARTAPPRKLLSDYAALVDELVAEIYRCSCSFADRSSERTSRSGLSIVATGGYGRRELNPFSDVDIAFVPSEEEDPWVESAVHMAFRMVMDVFLSFREIHVGYSFRPVSEVSTWDLTTRTALLDTRHLCGESRLTESLESRLRASLSPLDLALEVQSETGGGRGPRARSLYSVEPHVKEGPGSLRDLHRGRWIYRLLLGVDHAGLFPALVGRGLVSPDRIQDIEQASEWFWQARNWLHLATGKRTDVLINNFQDRIAQELGGISAQEWLSRHYAHAENLALFRESAILHLMEGPLDLEGVRLEHGHLFLQKQDAAGSVARLLHLSQKYSLPVGLEDLKQLTRSAPVETSREPAPEECWSFLNVLNETKGVAATLRAMARFGYLDRFAPEFSQIMRFVPPDPTHRYTVGEHSLKIIEHLEDLRLRRDAEGHRFSDLLDQCAHFDVLCLAALLHDAGKRDSGGDHSEAGVHLAMETASRLKLPPDKRELLVLLVRHHLLLVRTSRLQDLKSAPVIQNVSERVPSLEALRHLYVFTYVDTRAVAEKSWTSMDYRDLEELYQKVQSHIAGESPDGSSAEAVQNRISQIRRRLASAKEDRDEEEIRRHCDSMPASYILNTSLDEIAFHIQLLRRLAEEQVVLDIYNRPGEDFSELTVCTYDDPQPGMLAKITGVLFGCNADILKAVVYTMERERPVALDTLWIRSGGMQLSENRAQRVRKALRDILTGSTTVEQFLRSSGKHTPGTILLESLELRNDLSEEHTVVHIIARDVQGLLYLMTRALSRSGLDIHTAKVATWAARAENNFYVTALTGGRIPDSELTVWRNQLTRVFRGIGTE